MAEVLFSSYPRADYDNPDVALATLITVLKNYPIEVVREITSPETGLQRTCEFPPRIAKIVAACDAIVAREANRDYFRTFGQRAEIEPPRRTMPTIAELKAKYGPTYGIDPDGGSGPGASPKGFQTGQAPSWDKIGKLYAGAPAAERLLASSGNRKSTFA